jgi:hypothetical protein
MKKILKGDCRRGGLALLGIILITVLAYINKFDPSMAIASIIGIVSTSNSYEKSKAPRTHEE